MRLRRRPATRSRFGRPLIEIDYADGGLAGRLPIAFLIDGATAADREYVRAWLTAVKTRGHSVDAFIPLETEKGERG